MKESKNVNDDEDIVVVCDKELESKGNEKSIDKNVNDDANVDEDVSNDNDDDEEVIVPQTAVDLLERRTGVSSL